MKKDDISRLLQRYLSAREMGKEPYFDADEVDELLGSFEESDNYDYFDEVLALGLKLHPGFLASRIAASSSRGFSTFQSRSYKRTSAGRLCAQLSQCSVPFTLRLLSGMPLLVFGSYSQ